MSKKQKKRPPKFLQSMIARSQAGASLDYKESIEEKRDLHKEVDYIIRSAQSGISRVVGLGKLALFSSRTGDAWMLDPEDEFALCLLKDGEPQPYTIGETDERFAIEWPGRYRIEGECFTYVPKDPVARVQTIVGYPTELILSTIDRLRNAL
ncbi:MAG: hypothetical protein HYY24_20650 [Verrucomicrobia bacterium]|nr:hypothetical protein [Verrucomicrobiota bacterium]